VRNCWHVDFVLYSNVLFFKKQKQHKINMKKQKVTSCQYYVKLSKSVCYSYKEFGKKNQCKILYDIRSVFVQLPI